MSVEPFYKALGRTLQGHRERRKLTQEQLGGMLEPTMTRASIANIEAGKQRVLAHRLAELAQVLGSSIDDLVPAPMQNTHTKKDTLAEELMSKLSNTPELARELASRIHSAAPKRTK